MKQFSLPIFENLCPGWEAIKHLGIRHSYQKGCQIYDLQSPVNGVYLVESGLVEIVLYTPTGPEKVLYYVGPGCIFGEVGCFVSGDTGEARIQARSDCSAYFFGRETIEGVIAREHPQLLIELIRTSAYKIRMFAVLLRDSLTGDVFQRVCRTLVYLVEYRGVLPQPGFQGLAVQPGLSQTDLARLLGIHRVTLTKVINRLKNERVIKRFTKNRLEILDFERLNQIANAE